MALEDDDTACQIKIDQSRWNTMIAGFTTTYQDFTGAIDSGTVVKKIKAARSSTTCWPRSPAGSRAMTT